MALIVTQVLPKGVDHFDLVDGVWVTHPRCALPVAMALRQTVIEVSGSPKPLSWLGALEASPQAFMRTVATSMSAANPAI